MDFFEAQARAQKRTARLVTLFVFAVLGTVAAGYLAAIIVLRQVSPRMEQMEAGYWNYQRSGRWTASDAPTGWWDPKLFAIVTFGTIGIVGAASLYKWHQFKAGGQAVAESVGGRWVDPQTSDLNERRLLNVVEEMAIASGTSVPAVYVLPDEAGINAFAAGLTASDAVVAVTRGTLEKLSRDELQGVVAHEFSHILNGDMRMNLRIASIVFGILVLGLAGRGILWSMRGMRSRGRKGGGAAVGLGLFGLALMIVGYVGYVFGRLIQAAVSRQREYLADASAVQFTRNPAGIAGALKKIGGYALGSLMQSRHSTAIGHFYFAQGFRTSLAGLWSTHPPLDQRIRAIDPAFDGRMFEPPQLVDIKTESFRQAGFQAGARQSVEATVQRVFSVPADIPAMAPLQRIAFSPAGTIASIGNPTPLHLDRARRLLGDIPARIHTAAHDPREARAVVLGLLLDDRAGIHRRQIELVNGHAAAMSFGPFGELEPLVRALGAEEKLPLLQLALPALRQIPPAELPAFLEVLDELVHADARVSTFEFALQKLLIRAFALNGGPAERRVHHHSPSSVAPEISVLLSAMARAAVSDAVLAPPVFARGASQFRLIEDRLRYQQTDLAALDTALDQLARAAPAIKRQALAAAAHIVGADGQVTIAEVELLRAIAATLDVPMPPLATAV